MTRFTNNDIKLTLSDLRSKLRNGVLTASYRKLGAEALQDLVLGSFQVLALDTDNFNPQTVSRFTKLFDVPKKSVPFGSLPDELLWPSQDETATALQNFINRRSDPWAHVRKLPATTEELEQAAMLSV